MPATPSQAPYEFLQKVLAVRPVAGLRECSIGVDPGDTVPGKHTITFQNEYFFNSINPVLSPPILGSLLHGNVPLQLPFSTLTIPAGPTPLKLAYFNQDAFAGTGIDTGENVQTTFSPPSAAGQPMQVPLNGANRFKCSLIANCLAFPLDFYKVDLLRVPNRADALAFMSSVTALQVLASFGPFQSTPAGVDGSNIIIDAEIMAATSFCVRIRNITDPLHVNSLVGSAFLAGA